MNTIIQTAAAAAPTSPAPAAAGSSPMKAKVAVAFIARDTDKELIVNSGTILQAMTGNALYPTPSPTLATLSATQAAFVAAVNAAQDRGKAALAQRKQARAALAQQLHALALYVQQTCAGNPVTLIASGFTVQRSRRGPIGVLPAPVDVRLKPGKLKGQLVARCTPCPNALNYQWRYASVAAPATATTPGTPPVATAWTEPAPVSKASLVISALTSGTVYTVQVQVLSTAGPSDWSDAASAMAM